MKILIKKRNFEEKINIHLRNISTTTAEKRKEKKVESLINIKAINFSFQNERNVFTLLKTIKLIFSWKPA